MSCLSSVVFAGNGQPQKRFDEIRITEEDSKVQRVRDANGIPKHPYAPQALENRLESSLLRPVILLNQPTNNAELVQVAAVGAAALALYEKILAENPSEAIRVEALKGKLTALMPLIRGALSRKDMGQVNAYVEDGTKVSSLLGEPAQRMFYLELATAYFDIGLNEACILILARVMHACELTEDQEIVELLQKISHLLSKAHLIFPRLQSKLELFKSEIVQFPSQSLYRYELLLGCLYFKIRKRKGESQQNLFLSSFSPAFVRIFSSFSAINMKYWDIGVLLFTLEEYRQSYWMFAKYFDTISESSDAEKRVSLNRLLPILSRFPNVNQFGSQINCLKKSIPVQTIDVTAISHLACAMFYSFFVESYRAEPGHDKGYSEATEAHGLPMYLKALQISGSLLDFTSMDYLANREDFILISNTQKALTSILKKEGQQPANKAMTHYWLGVFAYKYALQLKELRYAMETGMPEAYQHFQAAKNVEHDNESIKRRIQGKIEEIWGAPDGDASSSSSEPVAQAASSSPVTKEKRESHLFKLKQSWADQMKGLGF